MRRRSFLKYLGLAPAVAAIGPAMSRVSGGAQATVQKAPLAWNEAQQVFTRTAPVAQRGKIMTESTFHVAEDAAKGGIFSKDAFMLVQRNWPIGVDSATGRVLYEGEKAIGQLITHGRASVLMEVRP